MTKTQNLKKYINFYDDKEVNVDISIVIKEGNRSADSIRRREKVTRIVLTTILYIIINFLALLMVFPFYWMIITSLKNNFEIISAN